MLFVSKKKYDSLKLDLECERVHAKKEAESSAALCQLLREQCEQKDTENTCLKIANRELVKKLDNCKAMMDSTVNECVDLKLMVKSLEARWGKEATI